MADHTTVTDTAVPSTALSHRSLTIGTSDNRIIVTPQRNLELDPWLNGLGVTKRKNNSSPPRIFDALES